MSACYFDVDGTLVGTTLIPPTLFYLTHLANPYKEVKALGKALSRAPQMAMAELFDRRHFNELLYLSYRGLSEDRLNSLALQVFEEKLLPRIFSKALALVERCRQAENEIVLVSGNLDIITEQLAKHLGGATVLANRLEMKSGYATGKLLRPIVAGPEKANLIRKHAREQGYDLEDCSAYSDSYSDIPMLSVVGRAHVVHPGLRLRRLAQAHGWPILSLKKG